MLLGVVGRSLSVSVCTDGSSTLTLGFCVLNMTPVAFEKKPDVCNIETVSPELLREALVLRPSDGGDLGLLVALFALDRERSRKVAAPISCNAVRKPTSALAFFTGDEARDKSRKVAAPISCSAARNPTSELVFFAGALLRTVGFSILVGDDGDSPKYPDARFWLALRRFSLVEVVPLRDEDGFAVLAFRCAVLRVRSFALEAVGAEEARAS